MITNMEGTSSDAVKRSVLDAVSFLNSPSNAKTLENQASNAQGLKTIEANAVASAETKKYLLVAGLALGVGLLVWKFAAKK